MDYSFSDVHEDSPKAQVVFPQPEQRKSPLLSYFPPPDISLGDQIEEYLRRTSEFEAQAEAAISTFVNSALHSQRMKLTANTLYKPEHGILIKSIDRMGALVTYEVNIGRFIVELNVLYVKSPRPSSKNSILGEGSFGLVQRMLVRNTNFAAKQFKLGGTEEHDLSNSNDKDKLKECFEHSLIIKEALLEVGIGKICAALEIGPKVICDYGADLICWNNCLEFFLEECLPSTYRGSEYNEESMTDRMLYCMRVMHKLQIVHNDIKMDNFLFSPSLQKLILSDFGLAHTTDTKLGERTLTYKRGTFRNMSKEMVEIVDNQQGQVHLYYNDLWGTLVAINDMFALSTTKVYQPSEETAFEDNFVMIVSNALTSNESGQPYQLTKNEQFDQELVQVLLPYFPELGKEKQPLSRDTEDSYDLEILLRALWSISDLEIYLPYCDFRNSSQQQLKRDLNKKHKTYLQTAETSDNILQLLLKRRYRKGIIEMENKLAVFESKIKNNSLSVAQLEQMRDMYILLARLQASDKEKTFDNKIRLDNAAQIISQHFPTCQQAKEVLTLGYIEWKIHNQPVELMQSVRQAMSQLSTPNRLALSRAMCFHEKYEISIMLLESVDKITPYWIECMARSIFNLKGPNEVEKLLEKIENMQQCSWELNSHLKAALISEKVSLLLSSNPIAAVHLCNDAIRKAPACARHFLYYFLANAQFSNQNFEEARAGALKCAELSKYEDCRNLLYFKAKILAVTCMRSMGNLEAAAKDIKDIVRNLEILFPHESPILLSAYIEAFHCASFLKNQTTLAYAKFIIQSAGRSVYLNKALQVEVLYAEFYIVNETEKDEIERQPRLERLLNLMSEAIGSLGVNSRHFDSRKLWIYLQRANILFKHRQYIDATAQAAKIFQQSRPVVLTSSDFWVAYYGLALIHQCHYFTHDSATLQSAAYKFECWPLFRSMADPVKRQISLKRLIQLVKISTSCEQPERSMRMIADWNSQEYTDDKFLKEVVYEGEMLVRCEQPYLALALLKKWQGPLSVSAVFLKGRCLMMLGHDRDAKLVLQGILSQTPAEQARILLYQGLLDDNADYTQRYAEEYFELLIKDGLQPTNEEKGTGLLLRGDYDAARKYILVAFVAIQTKPENLQTDHLLISRSLLKGNLRKQYTQYLIRFGKSNVVNSVSLLRVYLEQGASRSRQFYKTLRRMLHGEGGMDSLDLAKNLAEERGDGVKNIVFRVKIPANAKCTPEVREVLQAIQTIVKYQTPETFEQYWKNVVVELSVPKTLMLASTLKKVVKECKLLYRNNKPIQLKQLLVGMEKLLREKIRKRVW